MVEATSPVTATVSPERVNDIVNNLEIKFINCKILFAILPVPPVAGSSAAQHQNAARIRTKKKSKNVFSQMFESGAEMLKGIVNEDRNTYTNCIFHPGTEKDVRNQIDVFSNEHLRYTFINCRFIKRESRFLENIGLKFRRMLGINFNLDYLLGCVEIIDYKLKLKYIPEWTQRVIEQIEDE